MQNISLKNFEFWKKLKEYQLHFFLYIYIIDILPFLWQIFLQRNFFLLSLEEIRSTYNNLVTCRPIHSTTTGFSLRPIFGKDFSTRHNVHTCHAIFPTWRASLSCGLSNLLAGMALSDHTQNWTLLWTPTTIAIMNLLCCSSIFFRNFLFTFP